MCATYRPGIVGTQPSVIPPVVVDGSNPNFRWPRVSPGIIRYSFTDLGRMEGWVVLAVQGGREIWWYNLHRDSNPGRRHGRTMVYPLCYNCLKMKIWSSPNLLIVQENAISAFSNTRIPFSLCFYRERLWRNLQPTKNATSMPCQKLNPRLTKSKQVFCR